MKYTSIAVLAVLGLADAHRHHHHHKHNLAQKEEEKDPTTPDTNRALFDRDVAIAAKVVATEHSSENTRTSTHADAMAAQHKQTAEKNAATRTKYHDQDVENNVHHRQWVTKNKTGNWAQVNTPDSARNVFDEHVSTAAAVVAKQEASMAASDAAVAKAQADNAAATTSKKNGIVAARQNQIMNNVKPSRNSKGWRLVWPVGSLAQGDEGSPEAAYQAKKQAVDEAAAVTKQQDASEANSNAAVTQNHADAAETSAAYSTNSKQQIDNVRRGGVRPARDALGWRAQIASQDTIGDAGTGRYHYEPHVMNFVRPNIIYQTSDKSGTKW